MTPQQIELVKSTVPVLREHGVTLTTYFYKRMLNNNPELKMFLILMIRPACANLVLLQQLYSRMLKILRILRCLLKRLNALPLSMSV